MSSCLRMNISAGSENPFIKITAPEPLCAKETVFPVMFHSDPQLDILISLILSFTVLQFFFRVTACMPLRMCVCVCLSGPCTKSRPA